MKAILYYIHDPMCSWCWGFSQTFSELLDNLPPYIELCRLLGGLAPDSEIPMPEHMQQQIKANWHQIENNIPGVKFNFEFWKQNIPRRSTYLSCRAVIAARQQGKENDILMTKAIQNAYYKQALNPSDEAVLLKIAADMKLDIKSFVQALHSNEINTQLMAEIALSHEMFVESYPSLVLKVDENEWPIKINYNSYLPMYQQILKIVNDPGENADN